MSTCLHVKIILLHFLLSSGPVRGNDILLKYARKERISPRISMRSPGSTVRNLSGDSSPGPRCGIFPFRRSEYRLVFPRWKKRGGISPRSNDGEMDARVATPWHVHVARRPRRIIRRAWTVFSGGPCRFPRDDVRRPVLLFSRGSIFLLPSSLIPLAVAFLSELRDRNRRTRNPLEISVQWHTLSQDTHVRI